MGPNPSCESKVKQRYSIPSLELKSAVGANVENQTYTSL